MQTKTLGTIQTLAKIGRVLSKIVFIFSLIGAIGCAAGILSVRFLPESIQLGKTTIQGLVELTDELTPETLGALFDEMDAQQTLEARLYKALDRMEAIQSHNESDPATWLPLEYELNLTYGESNAAFHPYLKALRAEMRRETEALIEDAKRRGIAPEEGE